MATFLMDPFYDHWIAQEERLADINSTNHTVHPTIENILQWPTYLGSHPYAHLHFSSSNFPVPGLQEQSHGWSYPTITTPSLGIPPEGSA